jgi:hypothetical protein
MSDVTRILSQIDAGDPVEDLQVITVTGGRLNELNSVLEAALR